MLILDSHQRLLPAMQAQGFDIEDFFSKIEVTTPTAFLRLSLEERKDVLMIEMTSLAGVPINDELLARLNTFTAVIAFMPEGPHAESEEALSKLLQMTDKLVAIHRLPLAAEASAQLKNQLLMFWRQDKERERFKNQMVRFSQEMDELIRTAHQDMHKAKKIHEDVVPKRMEELKGATLYSKYAVGEGAGSEFFDLIRGPYHTHLVFLHTNSYLASSCLMGLLNKYKDDSSGLNADMFLEEASMEIKAINLHKKKAVHVELLVMRIEQGTFHCEGHSFGAFELFSQKHGILKTSSLTEFALEKKANAHFSFNLERGEKVIVFSPGFIFNWKEARPAQTREAFIDANPRLAGPELLMEFFFQLKKQSSGDFLAKDATAVMMEVNRHAIQQV